MKIIDIVKVALFTCLVFLATSFIKIAIPLGYIHAGDIVIFAACYFLKPKYAAVACGIGSMFADLMAGFAVYMPVTLVVKSIMALIAGSVIYKKTDLYRLFTGYAFAGLFMVGGYYIFEGFLYGWAPATANIPFALIQPAVGIAAAVPIVLLFIKTKTFSRFR